MNSPSKTVIVAGAQGVIGRNVADYYARQEDWKVIGLSRRKPYGGWLNPCRYGSQNIGR